MTDKETPYYSDANPPRMGKATSGRAYAALGKAAHRFGFRLVVGDEVARVDVGIPPVFAAAGFELFDFCQSPVFDAGRSGIVFRTKTVYVENAFTSPATVLHEMIHLALGPCSMRLDERYVLLSYEWQLAKHISTWLPLGDRASFLAAVDFLQDSDEDFQNPADIPVANARKSLWWRKGVERAQALSLLDGNRKPTFRSAAWKGSGVSTRLRRWSPQSDHGYPVRSS